MLSSCLQSDADRQDTRPVTNAGPGFPSGPIGRERQAGPGRRHNRCNRDYLRSAPLALAREAAFLWASRGFVARSSAVTFEALASVDNRLSSLVSALSKRPGLAEPFLQEERPRSSPVTRSSPLPWRCGPGGRGFRGARRHARIWTPDSFRHSRRRWRGWSSKRFARMWSGCSPRQLRRPCDSDSGGSGAPYRPGKALECALESEDPRAARQRA